MEGSGCINPRILDLGTQVKVKVKVTLQLMISQSVCLSWCRAPSGDHDQIFLLVWKLTVLSVWGAFSDDRTSLSFVKVSVSSISQLSICAFIYILLLTSCLYIQYSVQGLCHSRLSTADYALFLVASITTVVWLVERSYAWPPSQ
jgi:hypothetical protein